jgi:hypothetical protein
MRRMSMATRDELLAAVAVRYRESSRAEKTRILDGFAAVTGHHRKHAVRLLRSGPSNRQSASRARPRRLCCCLPEHFAGCDLSGL